MAHATFNILFLSRHNAARSILTEAVVNHKGRGRFLAFSAGNEPNRETDPLVLDVLKLGGYPTDGLHPKHWKDFTGANAPALDFVFALTDHEAGEDAPPWPSQEVTADWRYPDPVAVEGEEWERRRVIGETLAALERQFSAFAQLPPESLAAAARAAGRPNSAVPPASNMRDRGSRGRYGPLAEVGTRFQLRSTISLLAELDLEAGHGKVDEGKQHHGHKRRDVYFAQQESCWQRNYHLRRSSPSRGLTLLKICCPTDLYPHVR